MHNTSVWPLQKIQPDYDVNVSLLRYAPTFIKFSIQNYAKYVCTVGVKIQSAFPVRVQIGGKMVDVLQLCSLIQGLVSELETLSLIREEMEMM